MSALAPQDTTRLRAVHSQWTSAREARDFDRADRLRRYLENAGCVAPDYTRWHPVFESTPHRTRRLKEHRRNAS